MLNYTWKQNKYMKDTQTGHVSVYVVLWCFNVCLDVLLWTGVAVCFHISSCVCVKQHIEFIWDLDVFLTVELHLEPR